MKSGNYCETPCTMEVINCVGVSTPDGFPEVLGRCHGNCDLLVCQEETKELESPRHDLKCHLLLEDMTKIPGDVDTPLKKIMMTYKILVKNSV